MRPMGDSQLGAELLLRTVAIDTVEGRMALMLLLAAGRSESHVRAWAKNGEVFVLEDPAAADDEGPAAAGLTVPVGSGTTVELRLFGVAPSWEADDVGVRMLAQLADAMRSTGVRMIVSGAGNTELDRIATLTRAGYGMTYVERGACTAERGWVGTDMTTPARDVLWFELEL